MEKIWIDDDSNPMQNDYVMLSDDLNYLVNRNLHKQGCDGNQANRLSPDTLALLGAYASDNPYFDPLRLAFDGQPVGSCSSAVVESFFNSGPEHEFCPTRDLVRLSLYFELDIYHLLALALKNQWEHYWACKLCGWRKGQMMSLKEVINFADISAMKEANATFKPDAEQIFNLLESYGQMAAKAGYTKATFSSLVNRIIFKRLHWVSIQDERINRFAESDVRQIQMMRESSIEEQTALWQARLKLDDLQMRLDNIVWRIFNMNLKKEKVLEGWRQIFGDLEIELREQILRYQHHERVLLLKKANPNLTREEIETLIQNEDEDAQKALEDLKWKQLSMCISQSQMMVGSKVDDDFIYDYKKKCLSLIRKIRMLTHTDHLERNDAYRQLTKNQKDELYNILLLSCGVDPDELSFPEGFIGYDIRTVEGLKRILDRIETILKNSGIDIDPLDFEPKGDNVRELLTWYGEEIKIAEKEEEIQRERLNKLVNNLETKKMETLLATTVKHKELKDDYQEEIDSYRQKADEMESELEILFKETL